jgi:hypothetical protein
MPMRRILWALVLAALAYAGWQWARRHPESLPWTPLVLDQPIGAFTGRKLAALTRDAPRCLALLEQAGVTFTPLPAIRRGQCGYADGVDLTLRPAWRPSPLRTACPVAAALVIWERQIVRPAARRHFGQPVTAIDQLGSYNCRTIAGSVRQSEHATADAIDIAGVRLRDGTRISVKADWRTPDGANSARAAFLHDIRDGACGLFATTLSPDYNAAHADHLHLDQAPRPFRICR